MAHLLRGFVWLFSPLWGPPPFRAPSILHKGKLLRLSEDLLPNSSFTYFQQRDILKIIFFFHLSLQSKLHLDSKGKLYAEQSPPCHLSGRERGQGEKTKK